LEALHELVARRTHDEWGTSYIEEILAQDPHALDTRCPRYAGILEESRDPTVIVADTAEQLAHDMGALADGDLPLVPVELVDLESDTRRLAHRRSTIAFLPALGPIADRPKMRASGVSQ